MTTRSIISNNMQRLAELRDAEKAICPNCNGPIAVRNPTGDCDHLYWPDYLTPEAKAKVAEEQERREFSEALSDTEDAMRF